jgi:uncharacterized protein (TIGR02453 family)
MSEFGGFGPEVRAWFEGLEADNSKAYFAAGRDVYEHAIRDQMEALLTELSAELGGSVKMFRQNRDIRFSRDKSPYKTNTYGIVYGSPIAREGLYASISAHGLTAGSGYHVMARDQLERYRDRIVDDDLGPELAERVAVARKAGLEVWGQSLATAPRGYPKDHARIDLLRRKSLTLGATRPLVGGGIGRDDGLEFVSGVWRASAPVTAWLDEHVGPSELPIRRR